jgi:DNA-binding transcriptional MerR regulator
MNSHYPIRAVARMTGLSLDTLRAWERRYEAVVPGRSDRGRLYSGADVARLTNLRELVGRGHAIGTIARLSDGDLTQLLEDTHARTPAAGDSAVVADVRAVTAALEHYDLNVIEATLNRYAVLLPPNELVFAVVLPLLQAIGARWEAGTLRPAQEHLVSAIVRTVLGGLVRTIARPSTSSRIVCATPAGERHELGLLCAALLAASSGYGVVYLGADVPAADIGHAAATAGAQVVLVSLTTPGAVTPGELRSLAASLTGLPPDVALWVGGPEAQRLLAAIGHRGRHVAELAAVVPLLSRHAG